MAKSKSRSLHVLLPIILFGLLQTACYEGWEKPGNNYNGGGDGPEPSDKPIAYILFEVFTMGPSTIQDTNRCFAHIGDQTFRRNEWSERIAKAEEALEKVTDVLVTVVHSIDADDCEDLETIEKASTKQDPWGSELAPSEDPRISIHLKASFWDGDPPKMPNYVVYKHWTAWEEFRSLGWNVESLFYFVNSGEALGYFGIWKSRLEFLNPGFTLSGTTIEGPIPNISASERSSIIDKDSEDLLDWVSGFIK